MIKSGWKTTEFWVTFAMLVMGALGVAQEEIAENMRLIMLAAGSVAAVAYSLSRGFAKQGTAKGVEERAQVTGSFNALKSAEQAYYLACQRRNWLTADEQLIPKWELLHPEQKRIYQGVVAEVLQMVENKLNE